MDIKRKIGQAYGVPQKNKPENAAEPDRKPQNRPSDRKSVTPTPPRVPKKAITEVAKAAIASESLLKTGVPGIEKAAKFLLLLGRDEAAAVIRHLKPAEIEQVSRAIAGIDRIDTIEANEILTEFGWLAKTQGANLEGGPEIARGMLEAAFGSDRANEVYRKAVPDSRKPFDFLADFDARQLLVLLKNESPQMVAMILPYLEPKLASGIITELPMAVRTDVIKRVAKLDKTSPEVIERVESVLRDRAASIGRTDLGESIDGASVLAGILKHIDGGLEDSILSGIEADDPDLSKDIRERLFTIDDILRVPGREMQKGLRDLSEREIALMLKGKSQHFRDKILENVSQGKKTIVLEEYDIMGTVRRDEAEKATRAFMEYFKRRWESGDLVLDGDDDLID
jgi:flagellar motor switch protein FliG